MSRFKLEFKLKQHTPMIHFQGEQYGATLRATELKPKLDKFILTKLGDGNYEEGKEIAKNKKWLIGSGEHPAFEYKVRIEPDSSPPGQTNSKTTPFFGGLGADEKPTKTNPKIFTIKFLVMKQELKQYLEENFEAFLANTNFGTRQSKGFGSFYIADMDFDPKLIGYTTYYFDAPANCTFEYIRLFYQLLRQGINIPMGRDENGCAKTRVYAKPAVFLYAKHLGYTWDKKAIKQYFFASGGRDSIKHQTDDCGRNADALTYSTDDEYLLRDLFGLSSDQEWESYNSHLTKQHDSIDRFKSPITFKPITTNNKTKVYFWANDTLNTDTLLDKTFTINMNRREMRLSTPKSFDFDDFFRFAFSKSVDDYFVVNEQGRPNQDCTRAKEYNVLRTILSTLKSQVEGAHNEH